MAADVLKYALWLLSDRIVEWNALLVGCIHDEIILDANENNADYVADELTNIIEEAGRWYLEHIPVVLDVNPSFRIKKINTVITAGYFFK